MDAPVNPRQRPPVQAPVLAFPPSIRDEIVVHDVLGGDERLWVPQSEGVSFLPLCLGVTQGYYVNLLRVRRSGVLSCHRHTGAVHAQVLRGRWYYLEHDWVASEGSFVMETPGETHTLVVPPDVPEMITWFHVSGGYIYLDSKGRVTGFEDVFTKAEKAEAHYRSIGLDPSHLQRLIR
jgi:2,4'-dihydroxyacetophenone dioxygenase